MNCRKKGFSCQKAFDLRKQLHKMKSYANIKCLSFTFDYDFSSEINYLGKYFLLLQPRSLKCFSIMPPNQLKNVSYGNNDSDSSLLLTVST